MQDRRRKIKINVPGFSLSAITDATGISMPWFSADDRCEASLHIHLDLQMCEHVFVCLRALCFSCRQQM